MSCSTRASTCPTWCTYLDTKKQTKNLADKLAAKSGRLDVLPSDEHDHEPSSAVEMELEIESRHT